MLHKSSPRGDDEKTCKKKTKIIFAPQIFAPQIFAPAKVFAPAKIILQRTYVFPDLKRCRTQEGLSSQDEGHQGGRPWLS